MKNERLLWVGLPLGLLVVAVLVSLPILPSIRPQGHDGGIFAYMGQIILHGGVPYRDAWDNKTPGVYYINALAMWLLGENRWALWLLEVVYLYLTSLFFWVLLDKLYHRFWLVLGGTLLFLFQGHHAILIGTGNYTETYALLWQLLCLYAGYQFLRQPTYRASYIIGLAAGLAFLTKQNTVGVAVTFIPALFLIRHRVLRSSPGQFRKWVTAMIAGGITGPIIATVYLWAQGGLREALEATLIAPNAFHRWLSGGHASILGTVIASLKTRAVLGSMLPLAPFAIAGAVITVRNARIERKSEQQSQNADTTTFHLWVLLTFGLDMLLANLSNRAYDHYYLTPMLAFTLLVILALSKLQNLEQTQKLSHQVMFALRTYLVVGAVWWLPIALVLAIVTSGQDPISPALKDPVTDYVIMHSTTDDTVLVWGASSSVNFQANRRSPSRFYYTYPLVVPGYTKPEAIGAFVSDLQTNRPVLIVDMALYDGTKVPPLDPERRQRWWAEGGKLDVQNLEPIYQFVAAHCESVKEVKRIVIYRCSY